MSRGLGRIERAILDVFEDDEGDYTVVLGFDDYTCAESLVDHIYAGEESTRAQVVAVLRAMHSLARKYPDRLALAGGKGREPLWIGTPEAIARLLAD
jgi:hypothetical protein